MNDSVSAPPKHRPRLSMARVMSDIAVLAVALAVMLALRPTPLVGDALIGILCFLIAIVLASAADRAFFAGRHRAFWFGFALTIWLCATFCMTFFNETRRYILDYGPPVVRARRERIKQIALVQMAEARGMPAVTPLPVSEWYLLASALAETGIGISLGIIVAALGGLVVTIVAQVVSRIGSLAERLGVPNPSLDRVPPSAATPAQRE
jgi:hypothetical protein